MSLRLVQLSVCHLLQRNVRSFSAPAQSIKLYAKSCKNSVPGYFFFGVVRTREFTHRTAETNINRDRQQEVVRVNANHVQFARDDLGSSVLSSPHQTRPGLGDSTVPSFSRRTFIHFRTRLHVCFFDQPCVRLHSIDHRYATLTDCSCLLP